MSHWPPLAAAAAAALLAASTARPRPETVAPASAGPIALVHATVIDGTGAPPRRGLTVLVEGGRIARVAPDGTVALPAGARVVDLSGRYLIPGLIDSHVHMGTIPRPPEVARGVLAAALMGGVTTVRDMGGSLDVVRPLAEAARSDTASSPRIHFSAIVAGPGMWFEGERAQRMAGSHAPGEAPGVRRVGAGTDVRRVIADARAAGATGIKVYNTVPPELAAALVAEAHRAGLRAWSHAGVDPGRPLDAVRGGADVLSHADMLIGEVMPALPAGTPVDSFRLVRDSVVRRVSPADPRLGRLITEMRERGTLLDATLFIVAGAATDGEGRPSERYARLLEFGARMVRMADSAGVGVVAGTDALGGSTPNLHAELQLLVRLGGLTPLEAIRAATLNGARALGLERSLGTVEEGKVADLVILAADPAEDIRNTQTVVAVMRGGVLRERTAPWRQGPRAEPPVGRTR